MKTVGKRLQQARLARKLSVEEVARTTKLRTERILDLENDTYAHFPNLAYAKGFLIIYAKFLAVDVSDFTDSFGISSPVGRNDYQYLSNAPQALPAVRRRDGGRATKPMLILGGVLAVVMAAGIFVMYLVVSAQRLGFLDQPAANRKTPPAAAAAPTVAHVVAIPGPAATPLVPGAAPALALEKPLPAVSAAPSAQAVLAEAATPAPSPASSVSAADTSFLAAPLKMNVVSLQPLKKTWVTVRRGQADSAPVFEDWLYPDAKGLTLHGEKFWISVGEKGAVKIEKNGIPVNYDTTSVAIE